MKRRQFLTSAMKWLGASVLLTTGAVSTSQAKLDSMNGSVNKKIVPVGTREGDRYPLIKTKKGWEFEDRFVMENHLGRSIKSWETIYHINGNTADNRIENLELRETTHLRHPGTDIDPQTTKSYRKDGSIRYTSGGLPYAPKGYKWVESSDYEKLFKKSSGFSSFIPSSYAYTVKLHYPEYISANDCVLGSFDVDVVYFLVKV